MLLTESERAIYKGIQKALDSNRYDQTLRLILADWYEERGREAAAECMRWLASHNRWPYGNPDSTWTFGWGWTRLSNQYREMYNNYKLPDEVHRLLPDYKGGYHHKVSDPSWWEFCRTRQFAEEAAVKAWEKWWQVR